MNQEMKIIAEPSIGQINYVKEISGKNKSYMSFEINLSAIKVELIKKTLTFMIRRHESLRTVFPVLNGGLKQVILPYNENIFSLDYQEPSELGFSKAKNDIYKMVDGIISNISEGPLIKYFLIKKNDNEHTFLFFINHIICDEWSLKLIERELVEIYSCYIKGMEPQLTPLKYQLRDYCAHQNLDLRKFRNKSKAFWNNRLKGFKNLLKIEEYYKEFRSRNGKISSKDFPDYDTANQLNDILDKEETSKFSSLIGGDDFYEIKKMAQKNHYSVVAIIYASFYLLIYSYTKKRKILLAALIADRGKAENKNLVGCLLGGTYLPMEMKEQGTSDYLIEKSFNVLLEGIQNVIYSHDFLELKGKELRTSCDMYVNYITMNKSINLDEARKYAGNHQPDEGIYYALNCQVIESANGVFINWRYNHSLFTNHLIEDIVECHGSIMNCLVKNDKFTLLDMINSLKLDASAIL